MQSVQHHDRAFMTRTAERAATTSVNALQIWQFINILLSDWHCCSPAHCSGATTQPGGGHFISWQFLVENNARD